MTDVGSKIEYAISEMKKEDSDLLIFETHLLNFNIPHILKEINSTFDYLYHNFYENRIHFNQRTIMKFTILDMFQRVELEIHFLGETYLNVYIDPKTRNFEGESTGFRFKKWKILNYNLELYYESI